MARNRKEDNKKDDCKHDRDKDHDKKDDCKHDRDKDHGKKDDGKKMAVKNTVRVKALVKSMEKDMARKMHCK